MAWRVALRALAIGATLRTGVANPIEVDPFAPAEEQAKAIALAQSQPTPFVLETHPVGIAAAGSATNTQTLTFKLDTVYGNVWRFDGNAFVPVAVERGAETTRGVQEVSRTAPELDSAKREAMGDRMAKIVLPEVNFREGRLRDVLALMTEASREHDPERKGVAFVLRVTPPEEQKLDQTLITFQARYVPVQDVLAVVAAYADVRWTVAGGTVLVLPGYLPSELEERTLHLDSKTMDFAQSCLSRQVMREGCDRWKEYLTTFGVTWPEGSSFHVVPELGIVTVRHCPDVVAEIASLLSIFDPATQSPPEPGRCRFVATDNGDGSRSLLLWDRTNGDTWQYRPALAADTPEHFARVATK